MARTPRAARLAAATLLLTGLSGCATNVMPAADSLRRTIRETIPEPARRRAVTMLADELEREAFARHDLAAQRNEVDERADDDPTKDPDLARLVTLQARNREQVRTLTREMRALVTVREWQRLVPPLLDLLGEPATAG